MDLYQLTNDEVAQRIAAAAKAWRIAPKGAGMSQTALSQLSGIGTTPLKRFEKTGAITLRNLIAILRAMHLLESLDTIIPDPDAPSPLDILAEEQKKAKQARKRAPKQHKD
ncbi:MAG TPA: hypothetical protein PLI90_12370 [Rhodocyclaceae bacterium]|nr:hypothetical protein [Rhodocyclaceae bacterium]